MVDKALVYFLLLLIFSSSVSHAWMGKATGNVDGDSIKVIKNGEQVKIRLYGIDCPEKRQAFGKKAKEKTGSLVAGKFVEVEKVSNYYGVEVAIVNVGGQNLNELLVKEGYAWVYDKFCKKQFCVEWREFEESARQQRLGIWQAPHIVPPWEWRREKDKKQ